MFDVYKPIIKKFMMGVIRIAIFGAIIHYLFPYIEKILGADLSNAHAKFFWLLGVLFIFVILRFLLNILMNYNFKDDLPKISYGVNNNVHHPIIDESDALVVKLSSLMDVCDMRKNLAEYARSYINSREAYSINKKKDKHGIIKNPAYDYLVLSYDIDEKAKLVSFVEGLLNSLPEENRPDVKSKYSDAISTLDEFSEVTLTQLEKHHDTAIPFVAFNLQRAAMLIRWGLTCNMLSDEEWEEYKKEIQSAYRLYFGDAGFGKFIYDYLLAVYLFHAEDNLGMVRERLYGITELQKKDFFALSWQEINALNNFSEQSSS
ncbi:DUF1266 domain-containing protein [Brenneria sp. 4F2]|nr:DUF1266 domain-containing protein [Brenneria bubanii]